MSDRYEIDESAHIVYIMHGGREMALRNIKKIFAALTLIIGIAYMVIALVAYLSIDLNSVIGRDAGLMNVIIEELRKDRGLNFLVFFMGCYFMLSGKTALLGKKVALNMNVIYKIVSIETDDSKNTVKIDLKDTATGDLVTVKKETKYLNYFKDYIKTNGETMPGTIAALV